MSFLRPRARAGWRQPRAAVEGCGQGVLPWAWVPGVEGCVHWIPSCTPSLEALVLLQPRRVPAAAPALCSAEEAGPAGQLLCVLLSFLKGQPALRAGQPGGGSGRREGVRSLGQHSPRNSSDQAPGPWPCTSLTLKTNKLTHPPENEDAEAKSLLPLHGWPPGGSSITKSGYPKSNYSLCTGHFPECFEWRNSSSAHKNVRGHYHCFCSYSHFRDNQTEA